VGAADGVARDGHGFQHRVRVAFQNGTIHERARVAFVRVADDELFGSRVVGRKLPFCAGREARAAASAKAAGLHDVDHLLRRHLGEHFAECEVTVNGDIFVDVFRVDYAAVAQRNTPLGLIEGRIRKRGNAVRHFLCLGVVDQAFDRTAFEQVLADDLGDVFFRHAAVERPFRVNDHDRAESAEAEATGLDDFDLFVEPLFFEFFFQVLPNCGAAAGRAAGTAAD